MEFCLNIPAARVPSDYAGMFAVQNKPDEEMNVQDRSQNQDARKEFSHTSKLVLDNDGKPIDLNVEYENQQNDERQENQFENVEKEPNLINLNNLPKNN